MPSKTANNMTNMIGQHYGLVEDWLKLSSFWLLLYVSILNDRAIIAFLRVFVMASTQLANKMADKMFKLKIHPMTGFQCKSLSWMVELFMVPIFVILERVSIQDDQQDDQKYAQVEDWSKLNGVLILLQVYLEW